jgi:hypothetical protein
MIGGSFYPETIGLANLAALNPRQAPGILNRDEADFDRPRNRLSWLYPSRA